MESRYGLLRGTLRAPAVGWMMYNVLVSNENATPCCILDWPVGSQAVPRGVCRTLCRTRRKNTGSRYVYIGHSQEIKNRDGGSQGNQRSEQVCSGPRSPSPI
ncbi:alpha/beta-Hydrolases superfamily protein [Actinidia rufa]|uniref:Alpha/beta-Hydrolases superfamily protein n=1 Tax=Actinidia rufa TaxID=165716 RepID=A0A7J0H3D5_9ERIC|nr:alpha/beta-Hydrolases superfamily protein [Actinidia rufa]